MEPLGNKLGQSVAVTLPFLSDLPPKQESLPSDGVAVAAALSFDDIPPDLFTNIVVPFVGDYQYRFVGMVNHTFHDAYVKVFPQKRTHFNAATMEHAVLCYQENNRDISLPILCPLLARKGDLGTLQHLRQLDVSSQYASTCNGESFDYLIVQWSRARKLPVDHGDTCEGAAASGNLDVLEWCRSNGFEFYVMYCLTSAAQNGHLNVVKWCQKMGCFWHERICIAAAQNGHLEVLKWCRENGCPWDEQACTAAASNGHVDVLKWLFENECPWYSRTCCIVVARNGHLRVVQYCYENGCEMSTQTCIAAAENGHLDILKWCHNNGFPLDERTIWAAARKNQFDVFTWCISLWDEGVLESATCNDYLFLDGS
jgi:Ankyrin repeats (many copies)